jgi:ankyrin repeat protein
MYYRMVKHRGSRRIKNRRVKNKTIRRTRRNRKTVGGTPDLITASMNNDIAEVKRLLEAGADVNAPDEDGDTALMWAVFKGHKDVALVLYEAGANPEMLDSKGKKVFKNMIKPVNVPPPRQAWQD